MAPSGPRTCSARARHDDTPSRPHDLGHRPLSQRSFLWPKRLTAGGAAAKEASSGAVGPGEALGTLVTISGYVKRPRYARLNTPMGADGAISCILSRHFSENHLCGAKELFASPRKIFRIPSPLYIETLRESAGNPVFSARVSFFCPRLRFFTQDRPFCMARELILATIDD